MFHHGVNDTELSLTIKNLVGKPWDHETVTLLHFNSQNKIDSVKLYIDTKHVHEHHEAHGV
jgi:hypothetical protein